MSATISPERASLLDLAARVPDEQVGVAKRLLEALIVDPVWLALQTSAVEDEELKTEIVDSLKEASASIERGEGTSHDELRRQLGLSTSS